MRTLPSPSRYLQATLSRWTERNALIRQDAHIMLAGLGIKELLLKDLRQKVRKHRMDDIDQLKDARRQSWTSWEERMKRLETWMAEAALLQNATANVVAWKKTTLGFDKARELAHKYAVILDRKAGQIETKLYQVSERLRQWGDRLRGMEQDLRAFVQRHADKTTEVLVSKARKQPYLNFVYAERDLEGKLAAEFKNIRSTVNQALERLARADQWVADRAAASPTHFEERKTSLLSTWRPFRKRYGDLRDMVLEQALDFEESRKRLRWIYDQVQRMRVVQEVAPARKPLLERLFQPRDE